MVSDDKIIEIFCSLAVFIKMFCLGDCTGISFIDFTPLKVCHYKREKQHQVFLRTLLKRVMELWDGIMGLNFI